MTVGELIEKIDLKVIAGKKGLDNIVTGYYVCDLLSWVISHTMKGNVWITVHTHLNIIAVAVLAELSCIIIPEHIPVNDETINKANEEGITLISADLNSVEIIQRIERAGITNA